MPALPPELLDAVAAAGGGKVALILGAGCSVEPPTQIPSARVCSQESHAHLVANGTITEGACDSPDDLSCLADTVVVATTSQATLVNHLKQQYRLQSATPNEGHLLAAALLFERVIAAIATLNFDLALSTAVAQIGAGDVVGIVNGPADLLTAQKLNNLYYLHRNAVESDPEAWVLRTEAMRSEWQGTWQEVVTRKVLVTPVVVFAGLGTPAAVLIESARLIKGIIPAGTKTFQVDVQDRESSEFFSALQLDPSDYVQCGWCDFMDQLAQRVVTSHLSLLTAAARALISQNNLATEDLGALSARLKSLGLLKLGMLRARLIRPDQIYLADEPFGRDFFADLLLAAALIARARDVEAVPCEDGVMEFHRGDRTLAAHVLVSGRGTLTMSAIEAQVSVQLRRRLRGRPTMPGGAIVSGVRAAASPPTPPADLVDASDPSNILSGPSRLRIYDVDSLRRNEALCGEVVG